MTPLLFTKENGIGKIVFNRPDKFNSFNDEMGKLFLEALEDCKNDKTIRAIYITGTGKAFSAGQDLAEIMDPDSNFEISTVVSERYNVLIKKIREIEKPIVAAINGVAAGAGANMALACDIVVATKSASFIQAFSKIGLIPDSGGTYFLPRLIGFQKASAIMMLGDKIGAEEAERLGMIYKYFEDVNFFLESWKIVEKLAKMPTIGLGLTKRALNYSMTNSLEKQLAMEDQWQTSASLTYDYNEGVNAFLEKRKPEFKGE